MGARSAGEFPMGVVGSIASEGLLLQMQYLEGDYGLKGHGRARRDDRPWSRGEHSAMGARCKMGVKMSEQAKRGVVEPQMGSGPQQYQRQRGGDVFADG